MQCVKCWCPLLLSLVLLAACDDLKTKSGPTESEQCKAAAADFMKTWAASGEHGARAALDSRAVDAVKEALGSMKIKNFDGTVSEVGEGSVTVFATGEQFPVREYEATPSLDLGGRYMPVPIRISVAKDTKKVIAVQPQVGGL